MPEDLQLTPAEAVRLAQRLIDDGRPFHAHEVLEATWKSSPADQRALWKGLAQIAVGLTHARRGNSRGAVSLLRRGAAAVDGSIRGAGAGTGPSGLRTTVPPGLDLHAIVTSTTDLADVIAARGLDTVPPGDLRVPLIG